MKPGLYFNFNGEVIDENRKPLLCGKWSFTMGGKPVPDVQLKADAKAIRANLRRQREQRGVKVSRSKLP